MNNGIPFGPDLGVPDLAALRPGGQNPVEMIQNAILTGAGITVGGPSSVIHEAGQAVIDNTLVLIMFGPGGLDVLGVQGVDRYTHEPMFIPWHAVRRLCPAALAAGPDGD